MITSGVFMWCNHKIWQSIETFFIDKSKEMKDKRKDHGALDEPSSE